MSGYTCPRRMTEFGPWERAEGLDDFSADSGMVGKSRGCTFCGSMHPEDFLTAVRAGAEVGPTDKSYKLYVHRPNPDTGKLHPVSTTPTGLIPPGTESHIRWDDMTEEQRAEALDVFGEDAPERYPSIGFAKRPTLDEKFYTHHLSPEQSAEFQELWLSAAVKWGYPGYPYRPLYLPGLPAAVTE